MRCTIQRARRRRRSPAATVHRVGSERAGCRASRRAAAAARSAAAAGRQPPSAQGTPVVSSWRAIYYAPMRTHVIAFLLAAAPAAAQDPVRFAGATCATPPALHCPDQDCPSDRVINQGPVVEMKTRRTYFLDYPCDLKRGEPVTFVLNLHGAGSIGNWQRHYFPILDFKDKYRLVIATPNSPTRVWSAVDDEYLRNVVESVVDKFGTAKL